MGVQTKVGGAGNKGQDPGHQRNRECMEFLKIQYELINMFNPDMSSLRYDWVITWTHQHFYIFTQPNTVQSDKTFFCTNRQM